jgi:hypothetical protein
MARLERERLASDMKFAPAAAAALLGQAVLVFASGVAWPAELPTMKTKRPEAAKPCTIDGMRGILVPGGTACVKVGGYISGGVAVGNIKH